MPIECTAGTLAELSACFAGMSPKQQAAISTYLLCQIANNGGGGGGAAVWGGITGTLSNQTDLQAALDAATIAARPLTGAGSPVGVVVPTYIGQFYTDLVGTQLFQAVGLTNADWVNFS